MPMGDVEGAVRAFREGRAVVLVDDPGRENEGDLIIPAEKINERIMAMMIRECSGIVCLCIEEDVARRLDLPQMVEVNESRNRTAFTVSIEAREGVTTGVSAHDRVVTILTAIHPGAVPGDLARPGHVFPLRGHRDGLRGRQGHTEGSIALARRAGFRPMAVLCELMNPDGTMMRGPELHRFAELHGFPLLAVEDLVEAEALAVQGTLNP
ncbi:3,4-dihydroxy-2-butanone-4-phosphate synthase [Mesoterricola silvestris]|uniref:3,4-dihydroxy-2-butanone 4-phosphate synthase n=1 Tax=Mesoterricola silvestris TaxID=2927979 RepID=A0AA48K8U1_9BACT|nr:3,4-dihydroxy-2-butanone-4-phosphate synthase [Mesoterricola silvestris]BDU72696.1 3,4-dihydroxy-2-butanone 4-phosphate synthase [Mesoterricola silvestris]